jgi:hypothetical protein
MKRYTINPLVFTRVPSALDSTDFEIWAAQSAIGRFRVAKEECVWWAFDPQKKEWMKCDSFAKGAATCDEMLTQYLEADTLREVES